MLTKLVSHIQHNAVAYLALVLALSGSAYAATALPRNSVGTKQLKDRAVTAGKLAKRAAAGNLKPTVRVVSGTVPAHQPFSATASCTGGRKAVAGGGRVETDGAYMEDSRPAIGEAGLPGNGDSFTGWRVSWISASDFDIPAKVWVVCLG